MAKVNVFGATPVAYPVREVEIKSGEQTFVFWMKRQDAFDEAKIQELHGKLCDTYLGPVKRIDRASKRVLERGTPIQDFPLINGVPVAISEQLFSTVAGLAGMQDWDVHGNDCYSPEELVAIAASYPDVWAELLTEAGDINQGYVGNECGEDAAEGSEPPSII